MTRLRYAPETLALLEEFRSHESWSTSEIAAYQLSRLQEIIERVRATVPFYADYPCAPIRSLEDICRFPILERETVRQKIDDLLSREIPPNSRVRAGTTGTTGANLKVAYTEALARANWAILLRQWQWAGIVPREKRITLFGAQIIPPARVTPPFWTRNAPERQILMSIFHLSKSTASAYLNFLQSHRGIVLEGFPSVLGVLADFILERGEPIPMRVVFTSGEPLYPDSRAKIAAAFASRVFDSYGMTEYCGSIQECERGGMHLIPEFGFLEILDDRNEPAAPGQEGHFVWTGFLNRAMPLIRYRIGDRGMWHADSSCPCGRAFPLVRPTITRESDTLRCPDGRIFSPRALNQLLKQSSSLRFCQFLHDRSERVVVRVVPGSDAGRPTEETAAIRDRLQTLLGPAMHVVSEIASAPIARPGGKIPLIVNQVRT
ncbi:MAG: phenylacetate--CoA ligase family protein [Candidatus Acidiferrales bacterium]